MKKKFFSLGLIISFIFILNTSFFQKGVFAQCQKSIADGVLLSGKIVKINKKKNRLQVIVLNDNLYKNKNFWIYVENKIIKHLHIGDKIRFIINYNSYDNEIQGVFFDYDEKYEKI